MIEKIRISLWDVFTFFMTGFFVLVCFSIVVPSSGLLVEPMLYFDKIGKLPTTFVIVVAPILLMLMGLLIEPVANYFERYFGNILYFWLNIKGDKEDENTAIMERYIKEEGLGDLSGKINKPYFLCKEYVETKQLSTTFMVFLARYGFYRNCCLITLVSGVYYFANNSGLTAWVVLLSTYFFSALLKKRADEFYSYQAPAVYSAFLIDNLNWPSKTQNKGVSNGQ
jgi:hypothetical protein